MLASGVTGGHHGVNRTAATLLLERKPGMPDNAKPLCPECVEPSQSADVVDRRNFIRVVGGQAAALGGVRGWRRIHFDCRRRGCQAKENRTPIQAGRGSGPRTARGLVGGPEERDPPALGPRLRRRQTLADAVRMYNAPIAGKQIAKVYTKPQQELIGASCGPFARMRTAIAASAAMATSTAAVRLAAAEPHSSASRTAARNTPGSSRAII